MRSRTEITSVFLLVLSLLCLGHEQSCLASSLVHGEREMSRAQLPSCLILEPRDPAKPTLHQLSPSSPADTGEQECF